MIRNASDDLERLVRADLINLAASWKDFPDEMVVRSWSGALRRLLADEKPTLAAYRKSRGYRKDARIRAIDLKAALGDDFRSATIAATGGISIAGMIVMLPVVSNQPLAAPPDVLFPTKTYRLADYLSTPGMIVHGQVVTRRQVIRYVANKLGGVHYDSSRRPNRAEDRIFEALDKTRPMLTIGNTELDPVHLEIVSIGQHLLRAPDVRELFPDDLAVAEEIPGLDEIIDI